MRKFPKCTAAITTLTAVPMVFFGEMTVASAQTLLDGAEAPMMFPIAASGSVDASYSTSSNTHPVEGYD